MAELSGGEAVVAALTALGVECVFGIVSVHNLPIYDAIARDDRIRAIASRHEQGAVHAADGYARATGRLGVAITSTGPGCANAVSGLFEAGFGSSPVLMITGQIDSGFYGKAKGFIHEAERQLPMLQTVTRQARTVRRTADIFDTIVSVARDVMTGRPQPGAVEIPIDLQYGHAEVAVPVLGDWPEAGPRPEALQSAVEALAVAERPVLWAGGGVMRADAAPLLVALAERLEAPVITTINGRGSIPEDHRLCVGAVLGTMGGGDAVAEVLAEADVVLAVGTRFQGSATQQWSWPMPGRLIHVDADPGVIGRNYRADVPVVADARLALAALLEHLGPPPDEPAASRASFTEEAGAARDAARAAMRQRIGPDHAAIMDVIRELLPRDGIIARDATVPAYLWGDRLLPVYEPRTSLHPTSAAIGPGLPLALGAAIGTGRRAVLIQGDGGIMLSLGELATAVQEAAPVIVCVFNDHGYGVLRSVQTMTFEGRTTAVDLAAPDFAVLARAMGMPGTAVATVEAFRDAFKRAIDTPGPSLIEIDLGALPLSLTGRR
jgi:acetolactate synthase I/II/III large subunit